MSFSKKVTVALLCSLFAFFSCISSGKIVPAGEQKILMQNEALESFSIAQKYEGKKCYKQAIEYYEKSMQYDKLSETAYYRAGKCYALSGEWYSAEAIFSELLAKDRDNSSIKDSLAFVYANNGKVLQAEEMYCSLAKENPYIAEYSYKYIKILIQNNKKEDAEKEYELFKKNFPRNSQEIKAIKDLL